MKSEMYQFFETLYFHAHCEKGFFFENGQISNNYKYAN